MKRKFVVLSAFLSVLLLFSSFSVKASDVVFPAFPLPVEGLSSTHYIIYRKGATGKYYLIQPFDSESISVQERFDSDIFLHVGPCIKYSWVEGSNSWEKYGEIPGTEGTQTTLYHDRDTMLYSSIDLIYEDGTIFFQRTPIKVNFSNQVKELEMGAVLKTIVKVIPMVMIAVVGFLGFRKAFNLLLRVLKGA